MCPNSYGDSGSRLPTIGFDLFQGPAHEITQRVRDGQADIAITAPRPEAPASPGGDCMSNSCASPCRTDTGWPTRARVRLSAAADEPFVALGEQTGLRQLTDELWAEDGIDPDIVFEATEIPTMEGLVAAGFGVAVVPVPRRRRRVEGPFTSRSSNVGAKREVGLVWDRERTLPPPAAAIRRLPQQ